MQLKGHIDTSGCQFLASAFSTTRFAKNLAPNARFRIHHATRVNFFPNLLSFSPSLSLSLSLSLALVTGSTAIQIQTSLLPARALIHTCELERAHGMRERARGCTKSVARPVHGVLVT